jgi:nicotinate-nucleotide adenylyltransferase
LINNNYKIKPQTLELKIGTKFTYDTIKKLKIIMPRVKFYWIMGADNLYTMHNWYNWKKIFYLCPIIVVNRQGYLYKSLQSKASHYFWNRKLNIKKVKNSKTLPVWSYLNIKPNINSSTNLRKNIG